jgi:hypothetical protein
MEINNSLFISKNKGLKLQALIEDLGIAFFTFSNSSNLEEEPTLISTSEADKFTQIFYSKSSKKDPGNFDFSECFLFEKNSFDNNCKEII